MSEYYDKQGNPMTFEQLCNVPKDYKRVAESTITIDGIEVWLSTVRLGIDHGHGNGAPVLFESMIFIDSNSDHPHANWLTRYATVEAAARGHIAIADEPKAGRWPE
ncbi:hypothetical protein [Rhodococcus qingshengii]|uniref:hypothetical protein n=1 Tax=Rhodococcus qingshengii TaxID=334542 RepID=UPI001ADEFE80|nr:hypothetical protein [Rhodococcus qingshengii]MCQ4150269.1 hypothetical protein [Rhodococcus qingshengii]